MKIFNYHIISNEKYEQLQLYAQIGFRVTEARRWLNPYISKFRHLFDYLIKGDSYIDYTRKYILKDIGEDE